MAKRDIELLLVGGPVRSHSLALIGPMGLKNCPEISRGSSIHGDIRNQVVARIQTPDSLDAQMKHAMIRIADKAYVLTDSSKFGHNCLVTPARCSDIHLTSTDSGISLKALAGV